MTAGVSQALRSPLRSGRLFESSDRTGITERGPDHEAAAKLYFLARIRLSALK